VSRKPGAIQSAKKRVGLAREDEKKRLKELRQTLKDNGVPWYKRLFYRS